MSDFTNKLKEKAKEAKDKYWVLERVLKILLLVLERVLKILLLVLERVLKILLQVTMMSDIPRKVDKKTIL